MGTAIVKGDRRRQGRVMVECFPVAAVELRQEIEEIADVGMGPWLGNITVILQ